MPICRGKLEWPASVIACLPRSKRPELHPHSLNGALQGFGANDERLCFLTIATFREFLALASASIRGEGPGV